jgi:hypothetical protein
MLRPAQVKVLKHGTFDWNRTLPRLKDSAGGDLFKSLGAARVAASRMGLTRPKHTWTEEEETFLQAKAEIGESKLTTLFNKQFRANLSKRQISYKRRKLKR